jgi:hypothetical protein
MPALEPGPQGTMLTVYTRMTTWDALATLNAYERAYFWIYNGTLLAIGLFLLWLGWRVLMGKRTFPSPRRAITWS